MYILEFLLFILWNNNNNNNNNNNKCHWIIFYVSVYNDRSKGSNPHPERKAIHTTTSYRGKIIQISVNFLCRCATNLKWKKT